MKVIVAIIKPFKLNDVHNALHSLRIPGLTVYEAKGHGHQRGHSEIFGAVEYVAHFVPKLRVEVIVPDELVSSTVRAILESARTGQSGDGKVYVHALDQLYRIRTGEKGKDAL
jgi:nitrogen regulatory protein P-II 2